MTRHAPLYRIAFLKLQGISAGIMVTFATGKAVTVRYRSIVGLMAEHHNAHSLGVKGLRMVHLNHAGRSSDRISHHCCGRICCFGNLILDFIYRFRSRLSGFFNGRCCCSSAFFYCRGNGLFCGINRIRSFLSRLNSEIPLEMIEEILFLCRILGSLEMLSPEFLKSYAGIPSGKWELEIQETLYNGQRPGSIKNALQNVKRVAASVRDKLSNDSWHILGRMEIGSVDEHPGHLIQISEAYELVNEVILTMSAFSGLALESMTRGMGWRFMDMGRRIERAGYMISLLQSLFSVRGKPDGNDLEALLEVADCTITYHARYRTTFHLEPIVDLLLLDELNPRAIGFQLASLMDHVEALPQSNTRFLRSMEEKIALSLSTQLRLADIDELMAISRKGSFDVINRLLGDLKKGIQEFADLINQHYFSRVETEKQLGNFRDEIMAKNRFSIRTPRIEI